MIRFHDTKFVTEATLPETAQIEKSIDTGAGTALKSAEKFWNQIFSAKSEIEAHSEEDILTNIFDVGDRSFHFEFPNQEELKKRLEIFSPDQWIELTNAEKEQSVARLIDYLGELLEAPETPKIEWFGGSESTCGAYNSITGKIELNQALLRDPAELVDTIAHEMRHAYQHYRADKQETFTDLLYKANFDNYISPILIGDGKYLFYTDYYDQFVEVEARAYAKAFTSLGGEL